MNYYIYDIDRKIYLPSIFIEGQVVIGGIILLRGENFVIEQITYNHLEGEDKYKSILFIKRHLLDFKISSFSKEEIIRIFLKQGYTLLFLLGILFGGWVS